ncbi:uncharacterized protein LOC109814897 [Cajanus cajan]|uniref:uncharacterized protein LOC109814897 n=1 Tax=Cajanus cajan TaxID=3821 RepID=UPI00098DAB78|nr:uncharacterized protein LOC109814897 [Cajanus cajan]
MENNEKIADYFSRMQVLVNQMKTCGATVSNQLMVEKVMRTLSAKFDYIVVTIKESKDLLIMKVEELQGTLEAHEQRLVERDQQRESDHALQTKVGFKRDGGKKRWKGKEKVQYNKGGGRGNTSNNGHSDGDEAKTLEKDGGKKIWKGKGKKNFDKSKIECYNCGTCEHFADECRSGKGKKGNDEAYVAEYEESSESKNVMLMATT